MLWVSDGSGFPCAELNLQVKPQAARCSTASALPYISVGPFTGPRTSAIPWYKPILHFAS